VNHSPSRNHSHHIQKKKIKEEGVAEGREYGFVQFSRTSRTLVNNSEEGSCTSDSKRRILAIGKWYLPHIYFPPFGFSTFLNFLHCMILKKAQKYFYACWNFSCTFPFLQKKYQKYFRVSKSFEKLI